jgi:hypothetical protein
MSARHPSSRDSAVVDAAEADALVALADGEAFADALAPRLETDADAVAAANVTDGAPVVVSAGPEPQPTMIDAASASALPRRTAAPQARS